ncbi:hypothetical protein CRM22_007472 [Opisthorchis felineus]|uniref:V-SNARE coiled-coil homology domain-containing protein n=1 Tax=Opisthorchis felineus TaxID=147828 RepID=A0A4S2LNI9_OPIFE|nr:hypothetical protein CRM22_007472 [Opisthorchis felineus]
MTEKTPIIPNKRLQQTQAQVNEVVDIMRVNVDKVLERDKNLSELDGRADALQAGASQFEASAGKLKRKFWWRNCKILILFGVLVGIIAVLVIVWIVEDQKTHSGRHSGSNFSSNHTVDLENSSAGPRGREIVPSWTASPGPGNLPEPLEPPESDKIITPKPHIYHLSPPEVGISRTPEPLHEPVKIGEES